MYYKPCVLICFEEESEIGKGSGRSIPGFDLHSALMKCKNTLNGFGGHSMAVGLSVKKSAFEEFKKEYENFKSLDKWEDYVAWVTWSGNSTHPKINIELL